MKISAWARLSSVLLHRFIQPQSFLLSCWRTWSFFAHSSWITDISIFWWWKEHRAKSKQRHFNKWHRSSLHVPVLTATPKSGFKQFEDHLQFGFCIWGWVGAAVLPLHWIRAEGAHRKGFFIHLSGPWTGKTSQLRLECGVLSVYISFCVAVSARCVCMEAAGWWSSYMIAEASKEKQAGVAWLFLM